jgi:hypothetical protein
MDFYKEHHIKFLLETLKFLDNMQTDNTSPGLLTKEFILKQIEKQTELENKIFELNETIKSLKSSEQPKGDIPKGYDIFIKMLQFGSVGWSIGGGYNEMPTITISDCPLMPDEVEYIKKLINDKLNDSFNMTIGRPITTAYKADRVDVGIGGLPRWQDNLANDRAWH